MQLLYIFFANGTIDGVQRTKKIDKNKSRIRFYYRRCVFEYNSNIRQHRGYKYNNGMNGDETGSAPFLLSLLVNR